MPMNRSPNGLDEIFASFSIFLLSVWELSILKGFNRFCCMRFRDHVLQLYRGQRTFYQGVYMSPAKLVVGIDITFM